MPYFTLVQPLHTYELPMPIRSLRQLSTLAVTLLVACASQPAHEAQQPSVAARHTSSAVRTPVAPTPLLATADDPAHKFDPPAELRLPSGLQPGERVPLLLVLHGFGVSSGLLIAKAGLNQVADQKKFAYLAPEGARDALGRPFWNAGKSCCDLDHRQIDDVTRLRELLDANLGNAAIDPKRVFVIGYSNGGFMAQRLACDVGDRIAGVVSVAGAAPATDVPCAQSTALAFLEIHGDADPIVHYAGGTVFDRTDVTAHTSAPDTAKYWAEHLSCAGELHNVKTLDLEPYVPADETAVQQYDGCRGAVELWTVKGGGHYVALQPPALDAIWSFVLAHPKEG
jgi:polyhydroxybutyrate depolymerase